MKPAEARSSVGTDDHGASWYRVLVRQAILRVRVKKSSNAVGAANGLGKELQSLHEPLVGFGTTETEKSGAGVSEAFAAQAGDAELIVGPFQQVQRQSVTGDAEPITDGGDVREDVKRRLGRQRVKPVDLIQAVGQQDDLLTESIHLCRAFGMVLFERPVPASWTSGGVHDKDVLTILPIASATSADATANPKRQPLML